ncbi:MAG: putative transposase [Crocinitomicaceae bacterium]|jgi:putative transposase
MRPRSIKTFMRGSAQLFLSKAIGNIVEQDHRNINRRISIDTGFKEFESAQRTLAGVKVVNIIKKDQIADSRKATFKTFCSLAA